MRVSVTDDGHLPIPNAVRDQYGEEFELLEWDDRLLLVPVPDDPLEALRDEARKSDKSSDVLAASALTEALEEAGR